MWFLPDSTQAEDAYNKKAHGLMSCVLFKNFGAKGGTRTLTPEGTNT